MKKIFQWIGDNWPEILIITLFFVAPIIVIIFVIVSDPYGFMYKTIELIQCLASIAVFYISYKGIKYAKEKYVLSGFSLSPVCKFYFRKISEILAPYSGTVTAKNILHEARDTLKNGYDSYTRYSRSKLCTTLFEACPPNSDIVDVWAITFILQYLCSPYFSVSLNEHSYKGTSIKPALEYLTNNLLLQLSNMIDDEMRYPPLIWQEYYYVCVALDRFESEKQQDCNSPCDHCDP